MDFTDTITFLLSIFLLLRGASRGFMNSLLGPFSIIAASVISIIYYQYTKELIVSLAIGLAGPILLQFILNFFLKAFSSIQTPGLLSRLAGSILTLIWGWVCIIFALILIAVLPPRGEKMAAAHNDVLQSISYSFARPFQNYFFPASKKNSSAMTRAASTAEAKALAEDPRFQKVLQDPAIQSEIKDHNFVKLMSNPKILALTQQIMADPETMKKVISIYSSQVQPQEAPAGSDSSN